MAASRTHSAIFVLITIFIDAISFGIVMPVLPRLLITVGHVDIAGATAIYGWMAVFYAGAQFRTTPRVQDTLR